jgi:hypothetical protein
MAAVRSVGHKLGGTVLPLVFPSVAMASSWEGNNVMMATWTKVTGALDALKKVGGLAKALLGRSRCAASLRTSVAMECLSGPRANDAMMATNLMETAATVNAMLSLDGSVITHASGVFVPDVVMDRPMLEKNAMISTTGASTDAVLPANWKTGLNVLSIFRQFVGKYLCATTGSLMPSVKGAMMATM